MKSKIVTHAEDAFELMEKGKKFVVDAKKKAAAGTATNKSKDKDNINEESSNVK